MLTIVQMLLTVLLTVALQSQEVGFYRWYRAMQTCTAMPQ